MKKTTLGMITMSALLLSPLASAHVGAIHLHNSWLDGVIHPFTGLDHLTLLLAIGVMAQHLKNTKKSLIMMATTVALMLSGLALGAHFTGASVESLIAGSLFVAAFALWGQARTASDFKKTLLNVVSISFILFHGWAHGTEFSSLSLSAFALGMSCSAIIIMSIGFYLSRFIPTKILAKMTAVCGVIVSFA
ncbi:HupE/UreJ protein [Psychromonas sp. CNPT3]|uniref:HupE/UreJ family protein n=1 Tax=Psychromonas sp. CNPT3 TaxID=314282 RepID=UPI00006E890B|nr:HupE/UreJ family protein [Psychromonas sp. CNPT3]AGH82394.1 HupE/UreJ protein [Psychromonas sp. CNPT3]